MKEINKLEEYLNQRSEKRKKRNQLFIYIISVLVIGSIGYLGFWLYSQNGDEENPSEPISEDTNSDRIINESPTLDVGEDIYPALFIEGEFEVGKPLDFVIQDYEGDGRHFIDFGDNKDMTIKNMTKHVYRKVGSYQIKFIPAGSDQPVLETINIRKRNAKDASEQAFELVIKSNEAKEGKKAFASYQNDKNPSFPGGTAALMAYLQTHMGDVSGYQGRVLIGFKVMKNGSINNLKVIDSVDNKLDAQVLSAFNGMPKWTPAMKDGKQVDSEYTLPFYFQKES